MGVDLFDTELCAALELGTDGTILRAGRGVEPILGWDASAIVGRGLGPMSREEHRDRLEGALASLVAGAASAYAEASFPGAEGDRLFAIRLGTSGRSPVGEPSTDPSTRPSFVAVIEDLGPCASTELHSRLTRLNEDLEEEVARRTREAGQAIGRLRAIIDNVADGLFAVDEDGVVRAANPSLAQLLGLQRDPVGDLSHESLPRELAELARECMNERQRKRTELHLAGDRICHAVASPVLDEESPVGAVTLVRDVTLEREVDRMKTNFIAMVSHELRTPLTSVLGFAKLTKNKLDKAIFPNVDIEAKATARAVKQVRGNVEIIISEGERLTHLINDVLDIAKMEAGRMEWTMVPVDPGELVERAVRSTQGLFHEGGPELEGISEEGLPSIDGDLDRLLQVLINLISNAAKFTEKGHVRVRASRVRAGVEFSVEDTGEGIDPALHGEIFEKFRQVGDTLTDKPRGTGLGLPICRQIVEAHEGQLRVQSALGHGSRFSFVLASQGATRRSVAPTKSNITGLVQRIEREALVDANAGARAGSDILVVDDDPSLRELLRQQLEDRGFSVRLAHDGYEAIEEVRHRRPDLVILDVMMPGLSGFDVAAMLKNDPETERIPILILTVVTDEQRGLRLGIDRYMNKPMEAEALVGAVEDLLEAGDSRRRVLVVDESETTSSDVVRLLEAKGYQVLGTCTGDAVIEEARRHEPDLIILESLVEGHADLVRSIRFERDLEHVLVIQLMDDDEG